MSVSSIASLSTAMSAAQTSQDVGVAVLKKSLDIASNGVMELLSTVSPASTPTNLPSHLGQNVNTTA
jgi:hypothetical protein